MVWPVSTDEKEKGGSLIYSASSKRERDSPPSSRVCITVWRYDKAAGGMCVWYQRESQTQYIRPIILLYSL